jgi:hypothetical protein
VFTGYVSRVDRYAVFRGDAVYVSENAVGGTVAASAIPPALNNAFVVPVDLCMGGDEVSWHLRAVLDDAPCSGGLVGYGLQ